MYRYFLQAFLILLLPTLLVSQKTDKSKVVANLQKSLLSGGVYDEVEEGKGFCTVRLGDFWGIVNSDLVEIIPTIYDTIISFDNVMCVATKDNFFGIVDATNQIIVPFEFQAIDNIDDNHKALVKKEEDWGYWFNGEFEPNAPNMIFHNPDEIGYYGGCQEFHNNFYDLKKCADIAMVEDGHDILIYPQNAIDQNIEGVVVCSFLVSPDGDVSDFELIRSIHPELDAEAIRIINELNNWVPAKIDGMNVWNRIVVPIRFRL